MSLEYVPVVTEKIDAPEKTLFFLVVTGKRKDYAMKYMKHCVGVEDKPSAEEYGLTTNAQGYVEKAVRDILDCDTGDKNKQVIITQLRGERFEYAKHFVKWKLGLEPNKPDYHDYNLTFASSAQIERVMLEATKIQ